MSLDLSAVMDEVALALKEYSGLNVFAYPPGSLTPPAGVVSYPTRIVYDETFGGGLTKVEELPIILVAGKATEVSARDQISRWSSTGPGGIKAALESRRWTSVADLTVTDAQPDTVTIAAVDYLAVLFSADLIGG